MSIKSVINNEGKENNCPEKEFKLMPIFEDSYALFGFSPGLGQDGF